MAVTPWHHRPVGYAACAVLVDQCLSTDDRCGADHRRADHRRADDFGTDCPTRYAVPLNVADCRGWVMRQVDRRP